MSRLSGGMGWLQSDTDPTKIQQRDTKIRPQTFDYTVMPCQACCWMFYILIQQKDGPDPCCQNIFIAGFQDFVFDPGNPDANGDGLVKTCPGDTLSLSADTRTVPPYHSQDCGPPYPAFNHPAYSWTVQEQDWFIVAEDSNARIIMKVHKVGNISDDRNCCWSGGCDDYDVFDTIPEDLLFCPYSIGAVNSIGIFGNSIHHA